MEQYKQVFVYGTQIFFWKKKKRRKVYGMSDVYGMYNYIYNKLVKTGRPEGRQPGGEDGVCKGAVFIREEQCPRRTLGRRGSRQRVSRYKAVEIVNFLLAREDLNLSACPFLFFTKFF